MLKCIRCLIRQSKSLKYLLNKLQRITMLFNYFTTRAKFFIKYLLISRKHIALNCSNKRLDEPSAKTYILL